MSAKGFVITDAPGNVIGFGATRKLAISSAAKGADLSFEESERLVEETEDFAHSGVGYVEWEDRLCISTLAEWEEVTGMTLEESIGEEAQR